MSCGAMEYQEWVFESHVRSYQGHVAHVRPDIPSVIENLIQLFIRTSTPIKDESQLLLGD